MTVIIAFITNRAYLDTRQDDGFRHIAAQEFTDIYVLDLGLRCSPQPEDCDGSTTHNVFGIQTLVSQSGSLCDGQGKVGSHAPFTMRRTLRTTELKLQRKLAYLRERPSPLEGSHFTEIVTPDAKNTWLNQSSSDFDHLLPLANRETKSGQDSSASEEQAVFRLIHSMGVAPIVMTGSMTLTLMSSPQPNKVTQFFADTYKPNSLRQRIQRRRPSITTIKWSECHLKRHRFIASAHRIHSLIEQWLDCSHCIDHFVTKCLFRRSGDERPAIPATTYEMFGSRAGERRLTRQSVSWAQRPDLRSPSIATDRIPSLACS